MRYVVLFFVVMLSGLARAQLSDGLYADFETSMGSFTCRLDYAEAPLTCANFVGLAEGAQRWIDPTSGAVRSDPFYDGRIFHRVIDGFMIQGGCPLGTGGSGPGYAFPDEFSSSLTHHSAGILSMANSGPDSNGSQFFITLAPTTWLDGGHSVFGEVVGGSNVVTSIGAVSTTNSRPHVDVVIHQIDILRVGSAATAFDVSVQPLPEVSPLHLSLTNALSGMQLLAERTNQCEISLFNSTNLVDWARSEKKYWLAASNDWAVAVGPDLPRELFRGARVYYPQAHTDLPSDIAGHTLSFSLSVGDVELQLFPGGGGSCVYNGGTAGTVYYWAWAETPYYDLYVESSNLVPLRFSFLYDSPTNGTCEGHFYSSGWNPMTGSFVDVPSP